VLFELEVYDALGPPVFTVGSPALLVGARNMLMSWKISLWYLYSLFAVFYIRHTPICILRLGVSWFGKHLALNFSSVEHFVLHHSRLSFVTLIPLIFPQSSVHVSPLEFHPPSVPLRSSLKTPSKSRVDCSEEDCQDLLHRSSCDFLSSFRNFKGRGKGESGFRIFMEDSLSVFISFRLFKLSFELCIGKVQEKVLLLPTL